MMNINLEWNLDKSYVRMYEFDFQAVLYMSQVHFHEFDLGHVHSNIIYPNNELFFIDAFELMDISIYPTFHLDKSYQFGTYIYNDQAVLILN